MNESKILSPGWGGHPPQRTEPLAATQLCGTGLLAGFLLLAMSSCTTPTATITESSTSSDDQWNVMVVPSRQAVFSQNARELFNKNCASCHSRDGRAQTPIARQRHVQDLSECQLGDDAIVEQILNGTHNKENTFKMPPFRDKLTRAEIESLVPLVKSFRSVEAPPSNSSESTGKSVDPSLVGLVNLDSFEFAVFEKVRGSGQYFMLRKNESHDGVTLERMNHQLRTVVVTLAGERSDRKLSLAGQGLPPERSGVTGWFKDLGDALTADPEGIVLKGASADLMLFLYSQLTGETLLQASGLSRDLFDVEIHALGPGDAARRLWKVLKTKGIAIVYDKSTLQLVLPEAQVTAARQLAAELRASGHDPKPSQLFPGGAIINLHDSDLNEVVDLYSKITGRSRDQRQPLPSLSAKVSFTTQTPLDDKECVHAFEMLLGLRGLGIVPGEKDTFRVISLSDRADL